jgi:Trk-type K+ transport system membrane component
MTKHDTFNYLGILGICVIVVLTMVYVQKHVDSLASTFNRQSHGKTERTHIKPIKKVGK